LKAAADDVAHGMSYTKAAAKWSVGQTTLFTIVKNPKHRLEKVSSIMSEENEKVLASWIDECCKRDRPCSKQEVMNKAHKLMLIIDKKAQKPGYNWLKGFIKRQKIADRWIQPQSKASASKQLRRRPSRKQEPQEDELPEVDQGDSLSIVAMEDGDFECPMETEVDFEEEIKHFKVSEAPTTPCTLINTSDSHPELLKEKIESAKLDNELKRLEIASKKIDIENKKLDMKYKKLLIEKVQRSIGVESDNDCDPLKVEM
jgi:Tc5 transposase DNA-binding domain